MKLTKRGIDSMTYQGTDGRRDVRWDDDLRGFGVRIYPTGKKAFVLFYRVTGRQRLMTLGDYGHYTLDAARKLARKHLVAVASGLDPLESRQRDAQGETVKDLCTAYIEQYAKPNIRLWQKDQSRINRLILPAWGNRKVKTV
ncbi:MAG TPA: Arm DNA-binding domain-containing protein, partial [Gammaproteobacteria bacterium]|nr:Arm DNA-binding domain-containing protein [Gammaproteobacteria bacterium]